MRKLILTIAFAILFVSLGSVAHAQGRSGNSNGNSESAKEIKIQKQQERLQVTTSSDDEEDETQSFNGNSVVRFESRAGISKVSVKSKDNRTEEEILLDDETEVEIGDDATGSGKIKVGRSGDGFSVANLGVRTRTNFPLTVNPDTNELVISTPSGEKTVILPSVAIQNMINKAGFDIVEVDQVPDDDATGSGELDDDASGSGELDDATGSGELDETNNQLLLIVDENGNLVYEAEGIDRQRFLGLLPVGIRKKVRVDAETGAIVSVDSPIFQRVLDLLSF